MYTLDELKNFVDKGIAASGFAKEPEELYGPIKYMLSIGGKRIRPVTCLMTYNLFKESIDKGILYPALALEIFHGFTLIHDDIMDKALLRRGQPTVHTKWNNNIAILSGDVMSIMAFQFLAECKGECLEKVLKLFTETAARVCEGQQYDINFENLPFIVMDDYIRMIGYKTAVLIACSAKMGAIIAGAEESVCNAIYDFAYKLGIAFQIQDDYMDTFSNSSIFGKAIGGDIMNNKKTWLLVQTFKCIPSQKRGTLDALLAMGEERKEEKIEGVRNLYIELGVKQAAEKAIEEYYVQAMNTLAEIPLTPAQKEQLSQYAGKMIRRIR